MLAAAPQGLPAFDPVAARAAFLRRNVKKNRSAANDTVGFSNAEQRAKSAESQLNPEARDRARLQRERIHRGVGAPIGLPSSSGRTPEENSRDRSRASDRGDASGGAMPTDYAAQARARGAAQRAASKQSLASVNKESSAADVGARSLYSVLFQGGGAADIACEDGGFISAAANAGNLWQFLLTIFPSFSDKMQSSPIGRWLPKKFDLHDEADGGFVYHGGQWLAMIVALTEIFLFFFFINILVVLAIAGFTMMSNPLSTISSFLSL